MQKFIKFIEEKLLPITSKLSNQRHLGAVRDGLIATIPITVVGSIFLLIPFIPLPFVENFFFVNNPHLVDRFLLPFNMSLNLLAIFACFGIGSRLAKSYDLDGVSGGISALFAFFLTMNVTGFEDGSFLSMALLGGEGVFTAILTAILAIEVMRFCRAKKFEVRLPDSVPSNIGSSFSALIPTTITVLIIWILVHFVGFDIGGIISTVVTPLLGASANSIWSMLMFVILTCIMWIFGMHPAVLMSIMLPIWTVNAEANMLAAVSGYAIPNIGVQPFIFTFLWIGGGGGTLALNLFMCLSKSKFLKQLGRVSIGPSFFNINEPILFGLPIVLNPTLAIPFFIAPIIVTIITYFAFITGFVPGIAHPFAAVWTMPSIFAGAIATASIRGAILVFINFVVYGLIYYPFFKVYEKKFVEQETETVVAE